MAPWRSLLLLVIATPARGAGIACSTAEDCKPYGHPSCSEFGQCYGGKGRGGFAPPPATEPEDGGGLTPPTKEESKCASPRVSCRFGAKHCNECADREFIPKSCGPMEELTSPFCCAPEDCTAATPEPDPNCQPPDCVPSPEYDNGGGGGKPAKPSPSPDECSGGQVWNECGSPCVKTCADPSPMCAEVCEPRCECPRDSPIFEGGRCLARGACAPKTSPSPAPPVDCTKLACGDDCTPPCPLGMMCAAVMQFCQPDGSCAMEVPTCEDLPPEEGAPALLPTKTTEVDYPADGTPVATPCRRRLSPLSRLLLFATRPTAADDC